ncbi:MULTISPECIES: hypothetical protein [Micrococcaceae]|uniref:hypothetical protein n=1 Tax=Micrococcaceae TaxID=1268 RepID=UPI000CFAE0C3|nr:hypothetical protein [Arthrobacter sp. MYb213]PRB68756.1 hypothetical protein CQ011_13565 [Arthrobacter sp. MYb213]
MSSKRFTAIKLGVGFLVVTFIVAGLLIAFSKLATGDPFNVPKYLYDHVRYATWTDAEKEQVLIGRVEKIPEVLKTEFTTEPDGAAPRDRFLNVTTSVTNRDIENSLMDACGRNGLWWNDYNVTCRVVSIESER